MQDLSPKVAIIGGGNVGIRYAYALMIRGLARHIVIVDIDIHKAQGEIMDLSHGIPYTSPVKLEVGGYQAIKGSDLVVITAGKNRKPGESRLDLTKANVTLYKQIIPQIMEYAPSALFLVVTNPVDILSFVAYKLSNKSESEVIGAGTVLDTARFRNLIAAHCKVDPRNVHGYILGEHGETEFPVWSRVLVGGNLIKDYCPICENCNICNHEEELEKIFIEVRDSGAKIIKRKGETSYGIGLALVKITEAILNDENSILPVSCLVKGYSDIHDVYLSLPAIITKNGVKKVLEIKLNNQEQDLLKKSANKIKQNIDEIIPLLENSYLRNTESKD
ncbi:MAG: L-lactate dehydrogenase [Candidatus Hodarchaeales archaeon]|jgi:L-lactate dehydrogenase